MVIHHTYSQLVCTKVMVTANERQIAVVADNKGAIFQNVAGYFHQTAAKQKEFKMVVFNFSDFSVSDEWDILDECLNPKSRKIDIKQTKDFIDDVLNLFEVKFSDTFKSLFIMSVVLNFFQSEIMKDKNIFEFSNIVNIMKKYQIYYNEFQKIGKMFGIMGLFSSVFEETENDNTLDEDIKRFASYFDEDKLSMFSSRGTSCSEVSTEQATYFIIYDEDDKFSNSLVFLFLKYVWKNVIRQREENPENAIPLKFFAGEKIGRKNKDNFEDFEKLINESGEKDFQIWTIDE